MSVTATNNHTSHDRTAAQRNKAVAHEFFARFSDGDIPAAMRLMSADATWWLPGDPTSMPTAGLYTKDEITELFQRMSDRLRGRLLLTVTSMVAEGDRVAIELESGGELHNGRSYHNQYHTMMRISDGLIREVREYHDTRHLHAVWFHHPTSTPSPPPGSVPARSGTDPGD